MLCVVSVRKQKLHCAIHNYYALCQKLFHGIA